MPVPQGAALAPTAIQPAAFDAASVGGDVYVSAEGSPPFIYAHCRGWGNWAPETEGLDAPTWLPILQPIPYEPGTSGMVAMPKGGQPADVYTDALAQFRRRGFTVIDRNLGVGGVFDYLKQVACRHPITGTMDLLHLDQFETPLPRRGNKALKMVRDRAAWNRWRLALVEAGVIAPPIGGELDETIKAATRYVLDRAADSGLPADRRAEVVGIAQEREQLVKGARVPTRRASVTVPDAPVLLPEDIALLVEAGTYDGDLADMLLIERRPEVKAAVRARIRALQPTPPPEPPTVEEPAPPAEPTKPARKGRSA